MRKWILGGVGVVVVIALIFPMIAPRGQQPGTATTAQVERTVLTSTVDTSGTIVPTQSIYLTFGTGGKVASVNVEIGDMVKAGQVIATLDTADLDYEIATAEQNLASQQANYNALIATPTAKEISQADASVASAEVQVANAQVNQQTAPDNVTSNCADVESKKVTLDNAQQAFDDYLMDGYGYDAAFIADPNAEASSTLRSARTAYEIAAAKCNTAKINASNNSLTSAEAQLTQAKASRTSLLEGPTKEEIDGSQAALKQRQLALENAKRKLANATITAPFDGVISAVNIVVGQSVTTATQAVTLLDTSKLYTDVNVDELYINQVKVGQVASLTLNVDGAEPLSGAVTRISPASENAAGVTTVDVRISINPTNAVTLLPGMSADVSITVAENLEALSVPTLAIYRDIDGEYLLVVGADGSDTRVAVVTGQSKDGKTVITGNVQAGQTVRLNIPRARTGGFGPPGGGGQQ
jgi:HlyD family secretion protein